MTGWFFENMAWATGAMLLVLALRRPFARGFGAGPAYALWLLPALRLAVPPLPSFSPGLPTLAPPETLVVWAADGPLATAGMSAPWLTAFVLIWAAGAAAFLLWQWFAYHLFLSRLGRDARSLGGHGGVALFESPAAPGPLALGLLDRRIVVPADFAERYTPEERRLALDHETVHHRRGDLWWNLAALGVLALNWFNPVAWLAFRAFREDQELACDAAVAARAAAERRQDYARALVKSATRPGLIAACPLNHADQLKRRLRMLNSHKPSRPRLLGGAAAIVLLGGVTLAFNSAGFAQQATPEQPKAAPGERHEERRIIIHTLGDGPHASAQGGEAGEHRTERVMIMSHHREGSAEADAAHSGEMHHGDTMIVAPDCGDGQRDEVSEGSDRDRTRIILCSRGNVSPAERADRLQHVRDRLAQDNELSEAQRGRVTAALDREIARLRGQ